MILTRRSRWRWTRNGDVLAAGLRCRCGSDFTVAKFAGRGDTPWNFCAPEGEVCAFTGTTEVRYGANGSFFFQTDRRHRVYQRGVR